MIEVPEPEVVQAQYEYLESLATRFGQWAESNAEMSTRVRRSVENLMNGGWEGRGADAFFNEMGSEMLPAIDRFTIVLEQSQHTTRQVILILQQAEREAAALFGSDQLYTPAEDGHFFTPDYANITDDHGHAAYVYPNATSERIVETARDFGRNRPRDWAPSADSLFGWLGIKTYKCNLFVYDVLTASGLPVPLQSRWDLTEFGYVQYPPLAKQWADPSFEIEGWEMVDDPMPGDVASDGSHTAIVSSPGTTISAAVSGTVVENDWGYRKAQKSRVVFRRYVGTERIQHD